MPLPTALEKVVGKPWTAWVSLAGSSSPSDSPVSKRNGEILSSGGKRNHHNINNEVVDAHTSTHSRRLNRSEMSIFGGCPASEKLTLIPCSYCGDKFKCPALVEHIKLRHGGAKKPMKIGSPEKKKSPTHIRTKGKHARFSKDKEKPIEPPTVVEEIAVKSQEWPKIKPEVEGNHRNEREISVTSVVPQFMLKNSGSESVKESPKSSRESKAKMKKSRAVEPSLPVISDVPPPLEKSPGSQKRESVDPIELSPGRSKEKTKSEVLSKKAKLDQMVKVASPEESKISDVSSEPPPLEPPKLTQEVKPSEPRKKKGQKQSTMRGGRVYDPDNHCGVISKENSRPCTRSLICKLHSITLRKAVKGRSRSFDVLLSNLQKEKELERNKVLDVEIVNSIINHPGSIKLSADLLDVEAKPKSPKVEPKLNQPGDIGKLTLPVSIKNPNLWSQLQAPSEPIAPPVAEISKTVQSTVQSKKSVSNSLIYKVMKEDKIRDNLKPDNSVPKPVAVNGFHKEKDIPFEGFLLPGYRKSSGLLTTSYSVSRMHFKDGQKFRLSSTREFDKNYQRNGYFLYLNSGNSKNTADAIKDSSVPNNVHKCYDFLKLPDKSVISSMPCIATQVNPQKGIKTSGDVNTVTKPLNLFGPINGSSVLPLSLIPQTKDRKSDGFVKLGGNAVETPSAGIMSGDHVRLDSPRTHFFTPSGPISLAVDRSSSAGLSCKQLQPKLQYLPNSSLSTSGIVYLQRTLKTVY